MIFESPESNEAWEQRLRWMKSSQNSREIFTESMVRQWNSSGIFFEGFNTLQLSEEVKSSLYRLERNTGKISQEEFYFCRCSTTLLVDQKTLMKNVWQTLAFVSLYARNIRWKWTMVIHWSWFRERSGTSMKEDSPQGILGQNCRKHVVGIRWEWMSNFP